MKKTYRVSLEKEQLIFSAAHFITFETGSGEVICEQLHGHNYRVKCEVTGELNAHGYVVDFIALRDKLQSLVAELDHHVVLATEHADITVSESQNEVEVKFQNKRWVFPIGDCCLLPVSNTTAELMADYLCNRLIDSGLVPESVIQISLSVDENEGQWGECLANLK